MNIAKLLDLLDIKGHRALVFSAGGSADIILAKNIAERLVKRGWSHVDLAQPLNCSVLSEKGLFSEAGEFYRLEPKEDLVMFPRHRELKLMDPRLLAEARFF